MVVHFTEKKEADKVLTRGVMEVEDESACATLWAAANNFEQAYL